MRICLLALAVLAAGCGGDASSSPDAGPPARTVTLETSIDGTGLSAPVGFAIPDGTRSVTVAGHGHVSLGAWVGPDQSCGVHHM